MKPFSIPVRSAFEPGGDPLASPSYMDLPQGMNTWSSSHWPEDKDFEGYQRVWDILTQLARMLESNLSSSNQDSLIGRFYSLNDLAPGVLRHLDQLLGEGEVSARIERPEGTLLIQESVFAGIWRLRQFDAQGRFCVESIEVGHYPKAMLQLPNGAASLLVAPIGGAELLCGPSLLSEIRTRIQTLENHIINLTLLPYTPEDGQYLDRCLGRANITALSRGYGNCRITATQVPRVWWVQFFNSQDTLILNTLEITTVPEAIVAASEDLEDSLERLAELMQWLESE